MKLKNRLCCYPNTPKTNVRETAVRQHIQHIVRSIACIRESYYMGWLWTSNVSRVGMRSSKKSRQHLIASRSLMTIELSRYQSHNAESKNEHSAFKIGG